MLAWSLPTWSPPCTRGSPQRQRLGHCRSNHQSAGAYSPAPARGSHSRRDPFPLTGAFWVTSPPPLIETVPKLSPRFLSTVGHLRLLARHPRRFRRITAYTPRYPPRRARPYETSRGSRVLLPRRAVRTHLVCPAPQVFPSPSYGRLGYRWIWPTGPPCSATARRFAANPSDPTSRWAPCPAQASSETVAPFLLSVSWRTCAQRGITPAFGYGPRLGRSGWTLTS